MEAPNLVCPPEDPDLQTESPLPYEMPVFPMCQRGHALEKDGFCLQCDHLEADIDTE